MYCVKLVSVVKLGWVKRETSKKIPGVGLASIIYKQWKCTKKIMSLRSGPLNSKNIFQASTIIIL